MATKKKIEKPATVKAKGPAKKKSKGSSGKKIVAVKKSAKAVAGKKTKSKAKASPKHSAKSKREKKPITPILSHGSDLHLIPVTGEIHPARTGEANQFEREFKHNEETALHSEQQRAKQVMANNRGSNGKRIYKTKRQT